MSVNSPNGVSCPSTSAKITYCEPKNTLVITKPNVWVKARHDLTMAKHDLVTLAINKLYVQKSYTGQVILSAKEFASVNQVSLAYAYRVLKDSADALPNKKLTMMPYKQTPRPWQGHQPKIYK